MKSWCNAHHEAEPVSLPITERPKLIDQHQQVSSWKNKYLDRACTNPEQGSHGKSPGKAPKQLDNGPSYHWCKPAYTSRGETPGVTCGVTGGLYIRFILGPLELVERGVGASAGPEELSTTC